jgi:hypothetical protein
MLLRQFGFSSPSVSTLPAGWRTSQDIKMLKK